MKRQMLINYYTVDIVSKTGRNDKLKNLIMWSLWKFQISKQVKFEKENDIFNDDTISISVNKLDGIVKSSRPMRPKEIAKFVESIKEYSNQTYRVYYGKTYEDLLRLKDMKLIEYVQFEDGEIRIKFNKKMIELTQDKNVDINKGGYNKGTHLFKFIDYDVIEKLNPRALTVYMHIFLNHKYYMNIDKYKDRCETSWEKLVRILNVNSKENDNDLRKILEKIVTTINSKLGTDIEIAKSKRGINIKFRYFTLTKLVGTVKREDNKEEKKQPKETDLAEVNKDNEWAWEIYLDAMRFSKIGGQGLSRKDLDTLMDLIGWDNIKKGLTNAESNKRVTSPVTIKNFTDESKKWVLGAVSKKDKRAGDVGIWSIYHESRETWEEYKNIGNKTELAEEEEEEVY